MGMEVDDFGRENGGEKTWGKVEPVVKAVTALMKENPNGPFFEGKQVVYADLVWGAFLIFLKRMDQGVFDEMLKRSGDKAVHEALLKGLEKWTDRDDQ